MQLAVADFTEPDFTEPPMLVVCAHRGYEIRCAGIPGEPFKKVLAFFN